jgi:YHS domain-containing protein
MPQLDWRVTSLLSRLGHLIPNPATAKIAFEVLVRAAEIVLDRQTALAVAMTAPEVLVEPELADIGLRDFDRLEDAVKAGRRAAEQALPEINRLLEAPPRSQVRSELVVTLRFDPVCAMVFSPGRARARMEHAGTTYFFCSANCRDCFERDPDHYLRDGAISFGVACRRRADCPPSSSRKH